MIHEITLQGTWYEVERDGDAIYLLNDKGEEVCQGDCSELRREAISKFGHVYTEGPDESESVDYDSEVVEEYIDSQIDEAYITTMEENARKY
jgi:hypothetical protein